MKKVKKTPSTRKRKKNIQKATKGYVTVFPSPPKPTVLQRIVSFTLKTFGTFLVFLTLCFSWSMIVVIIGLAKMIFLDADVVANEENQQTFYVIIGTFVVVGLFSMYKTWRSWFVRKWLMAFWWAIFPLLYCGVCMVLLSFL